MATSSAMPVIRSVPSISGITPNCGSANSGVHSVPNRKSKMPTSPKKLIVSPSSEARIPSVVSTDRAAAAKSKLRIARSPRRGGAPRPSGPGAPCGAACVAASIEALVALAGRRRLGQHVSALLRRLLGHRDDLRDLGDLLVVVELVMEESLDLGPMLRLLTQVHEINTMERSVTQS